MGKLRELEVSAWFKTGKRIAGRSDGNGLTFTLSPKGSASWVLRYRFAGRMRELTLGRYPERNLEAARKLALKERARIADGVDPLALRRKEKLALSRAKSFQELAADYMLRAAPDLAQTSQDEARRYLKKDLLPHLGSLRIEEVTGAEIVHMVEQVAKRSAASARRAFQIMSIIYAHGVAKHLAKSNPCAGLKLRAILGKNKPVREKVSLTAEELGAFLRALPACGLRIELALRIILATGTRKGELLSARKTDVDLEKALWTIRSENSKNGKEFVVPLAPAVVEWFRKLIAMAGSSQWVLPGRDPRIGANRATLNAAMSRLRLSQQFGPHTLRRTMRSHLSALGVDVIVAEKCLNHTLGGLIDVYDRGDYLEQRREALEPWASFLDHCEQGRPWNVAPLRAVA
jgi:integrase